MSNLYFLLCSFSFWFPFTLTLSEICNFLFHLSSNLRQLMHNYNVRGSQVIWEFDIERDVRL